MSWWMWALVIAVSWVALASVLAVTVGAMISDADRRDERETLRQHAAQRRARHRGVPGRRAG